MSVLAPALDGARRAAHDLHRDQRRRDQRGLLRLERATCRPTEAAEGGIERWREVQQGHGRAPDPDCARRRSPLLRYAGEILSLPGVRLPSLLDPKPFERNLDRWIDWDGRPPNVDDGRRRRRRHRRDRRAHRPHGRVRRGPRASAVTHRSHAIDYVRDAARRPARARLGGDPDPVPAGAGRAARARRAAGTSTAARG